MFDKYKKYKTAGIIVILVCIAIFLAANIRISTVKSHDRDKDNKNVDNFTQETTLGGYQSGAGENSENVNDGYMGLAGTKAEDISGASSDSGTADGAGAINSAGGINGADNLGSLNEGSDDSVSSDNAADKSGSLPQNNAQGGSVPQNSENQDSHNQNEQSDNTNNQNADDKNDNTDEKYITCTIEIRCDSAVERLDEIKNPGIVQYIPKDGAVLKKVSYNVKEGTSVYELLAMAASDNNIPIAASYDKSYIMSINNLSEKMIGKWSGWMYSVNNRSPQVSANKCILRENDIVLWNYVCS